MGLTQVANATADAVTLDEIKAQAGIESASWDALLTSDRAAATQLIEEWTGRAIGAQTWKLVLDQFAPVIELPRGPVTGITAITYLNGSGVLTTLPSGDYIVDLVSDPQRIVPTSNWPVTQDRIAAVSITFETGFVTVPPLLKKAICLTVAAWFQNREQGLLPANVAQMLEPYRDGWIAA